MFHFDQTFHQVIHGHGVGNKLNSFRVAALHFRHFTALICRRSSRTSLRRTITAQEDFLTTTFSATGQDREQETGHHRRAIEALLDVSTWYQWQINYPNTTSSAARPPRAPMIWPMGSGDQHVPHRVRSQTSA